MPLQKNDFIEIEFIARIKDAGVFDSNIKEELKKLNPKAPDNQAKPFTFAIGQDMFLKGIDNFLINKSDKPGEYKIDLKPADAFGSRNPALIQRMPIKVFHEHELNPVPGIAFNFDGRLGRILAVSGGRVMVDFNNPLAGKEVVYEIKVLKKVTNINEKIKALNDFFFKKDLEFKVEGKKLIFSVDKNMKKLVELFKDKYKNILNLDLEVKEVAEEEKKGQKKQEVKEDDKKLKGSD